MKTDDAMEIIFSSPQDPELMEALEDAKKTSSPDEWLEVSKTVLNNVEEFVQQHMAPESVGESG